MAGQLHSKNIYITHVENTISFIFIKLTFNAYLLNPSISLTQSAATSHYFNLKAVQNVPKVIILESVPLHVLPFSVHYQQH